MSNPIKVFIVDDHQIVIDGIKSLLAKSKNIKIIGEASNGKELLDDLIDNLPDVILLDINMPVLNGYETSMLLKQKHPNINIIMLTMYDEKAIITKILKSGAKGYLLKNTNREELINAIETVYEGKQYISSDVEIRLMADTSDSIVLHSEINLPKNNLTSREVEILKLIAQGFSSNEIGKKLFISPRTVDTHRSHLMEKLDVGNIAGLIRYAISYGLID